MAINLDHVTEQITVTDTATNASLTVQPKGTGAFNIAAGSSGVNLSNGGTVTAITRTVLGGYTSVPSVALSAPTTAGGVQATATCYVQITSATIAGGGTGYTVGDTITMVGGTLAFGGAGTFRVATVSGGVITSVDTPNFAAYAVVPTNPVSITGGTGSGATLNVNYFIGAFTITNAGSGYVEQPTVTFSGGGGSGAAAYATVGSATIIKTLGSTSANTGFSFQTPAGEQVRISDNGSTTVNYISMWGGGTNTAPRFVARGADTDVSLLYSVKGAGNHVFRTNDTNQTQFQISHTASAVNYVQVTGGATGGDATISAQGSDSSVGLTISSKLAGNISFQAATIFRQRINGSDGSTDLGISLSGGVSLKASPTGSQVNFVQVNGAATGSGPTISAQGSDTNVDLNLTTKGTGAVNLKTGNGTAFRVSDFGGTIVGGLAVYAGSSAQNTVYVAPYGSGAGVNLLLASKGTSPIIFGTNTSNDATSSEQMRVTHTGSAVNYVQVSGAATGNAVYVTAQGSDTNVPMVVQSKGTQPIYFATGGGIQFAILNAASAVNYAFARGGAAGVAASIAVQGSDTNIPLVLQPKGTGALQAQQTDSTITGGNARGAKAVDWQLERAAANNVASSPFSVVGGGISNAVSGSGSYGGVLSGVGNTTTGFASVISGGWSNNATGGQSAVIGGYSNSATGAFNFIGGGTLNSGTANAAVTTQSATMNGTTAVTLSASNANIKVGQYIVGTSISFNTYVAAISGTSLTLSQAAGGSSTSTLSFFTPYSAVVGGGNNIASGSYSFVGGGGDAGNAANRNVANGDWSFIGGGAQNNASGANSSVLGGANCSSTSAFAVCLGGAGNSSSGFGSTNLGGNGNVANGTYAVASGFSSTNRSLSTFAYAAGTASRNGDAQTEIFVLRNSTTDATATVLTLGAGAAGTTNQVIMPNNSAYFFTGDVIAGVTGGGDTKGWKIEGVIKRGANAASTALVGTPTVTSMYADVGAATWAIAVTADVTNGGLSVTFTGQLATTIRVVAKISTTEMTF
jgi:hypothetical protein